ncbi:MULTISPECIES: hypothetical protein [unclassified Crossiella]|uniref:hypothetical protein n=1 Tax=unclassified Crossiella TaxID=2620835 RepID=UPI00200010D3|nr:MULTISPECIES: hypothetical protein [unclassified Crossiella]MCK2243738.1 hypothetical protein [Crossiella sp. S99.2]MCK2257597.1 hypothetical protein [Crossiella sp. S99.1]
MDEPLAISADRYKYWQIDFQTGTIKIVSQDDQALEEELNPNFRVRPSQVAASIFDWEKWWILSTTTRGDLIITEGFNPNSSPSLNGRPSVYLDQNRWRTVSDALHEPDRVDNPSERRAAQDLIRLATDGGIILPLSMGHMLETAGLHSERRYEVGVAMARLAAGWQIRNPLDIWKHEVELAIRGHLGLMEGAPVLHPIVTEPGALFGSGTTLAITTETSDFDKFMAMLIMPSVVLDTLVDPERTPKHPLTKWVDHHARITSQIRVENVPKNQRRRLARRRYWNENIDFYTAAYQRLTRSADFPSFSDGQLVRLLSTSPMVGLTSELFIRRFIDHQVKWRRNDLIDMFHLSSAAAYADYVCAEAHTGRQLRDIQRALGRRETVFTTLDDLVTKLRRDGARSQSERSTHPPSP